MWENDNQVLAEKNSRNVANTWYTVTVDATNGLLWQYRRGCTSPSNGGNFNAAGDYALLGTAGTSGTWLGGFSRTVGSGGTACTTVAIDSTTKVYGVQLSYGTTTPTIELYIGALELHFTGKIYTIPFSA